MVQITKKIVLGLSLCIASPVFSQPMNSDAFGTISRPDVEYSISGKINNQVDKILKYSEKLKTANPSQREMLEEKIGECQQKIRTLSASIGKNNTSTNRTIEKYAFDVEQNSLELTKFVVTREGSETNFVLSLKAEKTGEAQIDIISPGGELLESFTTPNFDGSLNRLINLSTEKGTIYFVHLRIGNQETTKKIRFS